MDDHHGGDRGVLPQHGGDLVGVDAVAPVALHPVDLEPEALGQALPERREVAGLEGQHAVAGGEGVDERRLPGAGARGRVDHHRALGPEDLLHAVQDLVSELREVRSAVVDGRRVDRAQHPVRHVGRAGDLKEMASHDRHDCPPPHRGKTFPGGLAIQIRESRRPARRRREGPLRCSAARAERRARRRVHAPSLRERRQHVRPRAAGGGLPARRRRGGRRDRVAGRFGVPVVSRGGGTSLAGQTAGAGRGARHLALHERDRGDRHRGAARAGRAGRRAGGPQPRGAEARLRLRARHLDLQPGHDRRDDRQQLVGQPLDRLRHHGRPRPRAGGRAGRRLADDARPRDRPVPGRAARDPARPRRLDRHRLSEALAPGGRLPARLPRARVRPGAAGDRLRGHAGGDHRGRGGPGAAAEGAHVRGRPLRVGGRRGRGHRRRAGARAGGGRDDRQHDPRAVALQARVPRAVGDDRGRSRARCCS